MSFSFQGKTTAIALAFQWGIMFRVIDKLYNNTFTKIRGLFASVKVGLVTVSLFNFNHPFKIITNMKTTTLLFFLCFTTSLFSQEFCDTLLLTSGDKIVVINLLEMDDKVRYEKYGEENQSVYFYPKNKILEIRKASRATTSTTFPNEKFKIQARRRSNADLITGSLYEFKDSSLVVSKKSKLREALIEVRITDIDYLSVRKFDAPRRGAKFGLGIGLLTGAVTGLLINQSINNSPDSALKPSTSGVFLLTGIGGLSGGIIGHVIGSISKRIFIRGNQKKYDEVKRRKIFFH